MYGHDHDLWHTKGLEGLDNDVMPYSVEAEELEWLVIMLGILDEISGKERGLLNVPQCHEAMLVLTDNSREDPVEPRPELNKSF